MRYYAFFLILTLSTAVSHGQGKWAIGAFGGVGKSFNLDYNDYYEQKIVLPDYSYGLNLSVKLGEKSRLRLGGAIEKTGLERDWKVADNTLKQPEKTTLNVFYLDLHLRFDYLLFQHNKLGIYASPGVKTLLSMGDHETTSLTTGKETTSNYLNIHYKRTMAGASMQLLVKYNLTNHLGITLAPDYTYVPAEFYYKCKGNIQQVALTAGLEWNF